MVTGTGSQDDGSTFLTKVMIKDYKSIAACDVVLGPLTFLVGPNGAGKSNFLDALRLVADALNTTLDHALRDRGGVSEVQRRSSDHPRHFGVRLDFHLPSGRTGYYSFAVGTRAQGGFEVQQEECVIESAEALTPADRFDVREGQVTWSPAQPPPPAASDRLYLVLASGHPAFRPVFDHLSRMGFYNLNPDRIRDLQSPDAGAILARDGSNLASVLGELGARDPALKARVEEFLSQIVPGLTSVDRREVSPRETVEFRQQAAGADHPWRFSAANMSDGTLRALGVLLALFQDGDGMGPAVPLVGIEEPEVALHPAAAGVLLDALREASVRTQVIVTSHSPDLLDTPDLDPRALLAVVGGDDATVIGPVNAVGAGMLRQRLFTPGELLRLDQLTPADEPRRVARGRQLQLFGPVV